MRYSIFKVILLPLLLLSGQLAFASHMIGGDITYICLGNNRFEFTLTLYQDCLNGEQEAILQDQPAFYAIFSKGPGSPMVRSGQVGPVSTEIVDPGFSNECINNFPQTCLRKQVFRFAETLPPNPYGYTIVYQRCCRNQSINNLVNPGNIGVTYMAEIPPFSNETGCVNNSAVFKSLPPQIICVNNPFVYDFSAVDPDGDSLTYQLCAARPGGSMTNPKPNPSAGEIPPPPYGSVAYTPPYSALNPVSGLPPLQINTTTGLMTGTPNIMGRFVVTVCVNEWRNGEIINTLSRDVQFVITNCSRAVVADIPELPDEPNTYTIQCDGYTVDFKNESTGGFSYHWDFGVPGATSDAFEPSYTYPDTGTYVVSLVVNRGSTCPDSITRLVKIYPEFHANFTWDGLLCPGEPIQFTDSTFATYEPIESWLWDFGDGSTSTLQNPVHTFAKPGGPQTIRMSARSAIGCRDTITHTLPLAEFNLDAGNDTIIVLDYPFSLNGKGSQHYSWSPADYLSDPNIANPEVQFPDTGTYTYVLQGRTDEGCTDIDTIRIQVVKGGQIFIPNAFSPNGDGINDKVIVRIVGYTRITSFRIFNRYGQTVYASSVNNNPEWDGRYNGKPGETGTYYWSIEVVDIFGETVTKSGDIILLR